MAIIELKEARNKEEEAMRRWKNSFKKEVNDLGADDGGVLAKWLLKLSLICRLRKKSGYF